MSKISEIKKARDEYLRAQENLAQKMAGITIGEDKTSKSYHTGYVKYYPDTDEVCICNVKKFSDILFDVQSIPDIIKALQELIE